MNLFLIQIGPAGWILLLTAVWSLFLFIKCSVFTALIAHDFRKQFAAMEKGQHDPLEDNPRWRGNPMLAIMQDIARFHANHSRDLKSEVAFLFYKYFRKINHSVAWLRMLSAVAPLLGLMGTVLGMVRMFRALASEDQVDAALLAGGIWEALLTTALGLAVAIPSLVFYYRLSLRLREFAIEAVEYGYRMLGLIHPQCPYGKIQDELERGDV